MKAITETQPRASLVALGVVTVLTRAKPTGHRGPLAIHAGARRPNRVWSQGERDLPPGLDLITMDRYYRITEAANEPGQFCYDWAGPLGAIVATCTLVDVVPIVAESECSKVPGRGPIIAVSRNGECVTGLTWRNTVSPARYIDREWCGQIYAQRPYVTFTPGRYAWLLADVCPLREPEPARGRPGLWEWNEFVSQDVER